MTPATFVFRLITIVTAIFGFKIGVPYRIFYYSLVHYIYLSNTDVAGFEGDVSYPNTDHKYQIHYSDSYTNLELT